MSKKPGRKKKQLHLPHVPESKKKKPGNPVLAFRVDSDLLSRFVKKHKGLPAAQDAIRAFIKRSV